MKLFNVPRNTKIRVLDDAQSPPGAQVIHNSDELMFYEIDGMYSYCEDSDGNTVHLIAWAEVEII